MDDRDILPRIGTFFIVIGTASVLLFVISDIAETIAFNYLFIGLLLLGIGFFFRRKVEKSPSSKRFEWWNKMRKKDK